jgi:arabinofuranosyltransferase
MALLSLFATAWAAWRLCQGKRRSDLTLLGLGCVLLCVVSNRSFLVWSSSGLETALFNLLVEAWILLLFVARWDSPRRRVHRAYAVSAIAALLCLARPDGLLFAATTLSMIAIWARLGVLPGRRAALCGLLLSPALAHELFRYATYGEWLPNTYYAKVVGAWPAAGLRYAASFVLEYAYYLAIPWMLWGLAHAQVRAFRTIRTAAQRAIWLGRNIGAFTLCAKLGFDVLIAGGDHFEYRSLSYWVPLIALGFLYTCLELKRSARVVAVLFVGFIATSAVLPWTYYAQTRAHFAWPPEPRVLAIAPDVPFVLRPIARAFDDLQAWLIPRGIGVRQNEHRAFWLRLLSEYPSRAVGTRACSSAQRPIAAIPNVGVAGWVLATCDILDLRGLNDYVIARTTPRDRERSYLAHERRPPAGYIERFRPNVIVNDQHVVIRARGAPFRDEEIIAAENYGRASLTMQSPHRD